MAEYRLTPRTAFGAETPHTATQGAVTLTERPGFALASVTARQGEDLSALVAALAGGPCDVSVYREGDGMAVFWAGPGQWFVMADRAAQDDLAGDLGNRFGGRASVTEQSDGWAIFDLTGEHLDAVLERLCNVDPVALGAGRVVRTVIEHIPAFVIAVAPGGAYRLLCGRSYAASFAHVVETAMASAAAQTGA